MIPQYQFNLNAVDPVLTNSGSQIDYTTYIDEQINQLQAYKEQLANNRPIQPQVKAQNKSNLFDEINNQVSALTNSQKEILFKDKEYAENEYAIQALIQDELINLVKGKIQNSPYGKELLEKQLKLVKDKKSLIVEESNKEMELFKKFQVAVQANPNLSYAEFLKQYNNK